MRTIFEQLHDAYTQSGLSVAELLKATGLELERSTMQRKLAGETEIRLHEAQAIAKALGVTLVWPETPGRRSRGAC